MTDKFQLLRSLLETKENSTPFDLSGLIWRDQPERADVPRGFTDAHFRDISFTNAHLEYKSLIRSQIDSFNFDSSKLDEVMFTFSTLNDCSFVDAKIRFFVGKASFHRCNFSRAVIHQRSMMALIGQARFVECDFTGCTFKKLAARECTFDDCIWSETSFQQVDFINTRFSGKIPTPDQFTKSDVFSYLDPQLNPLLRM